MTEYEKLVNAADLIHELSGGKLSLRPSVVGQVYVAASDDAYIGMDLIETHDMENQRFDLSFYAYVRRMGSHLDSGGLREIQSEVHNAYALLTALELQDFHPTQEDMQDLREHLLRQEEQTQQQTGPVMG